MENVCTIRKTDNIYINCMDKPLNESEKETVREIFSNLVNIDVKKHIKKKMNLSYLSWADAYSILMTEYPDATIQEYWFQDSEGQHHPYFHDETGYYVMVGVTIKGVEKREKLCVLDFRNKPVEQPTSFNINYTTKRCWAKAMARWGLGLYIYAGEDVPDGIETGSPPVISNNKSSKEIKKGDPINKMTESEIDTLLQRRALFFKHGEGSPPVISNNKSSKEIKKGDPIDKMTESEINTLLQIANLDFPAAKEALKNKFKIEKEMPEFVQDLNQKQAEWFYNNLKESLKRENEK